MPTDIHSDEMRTILEEYRSLELRVGSLMRCICLPFCQTCATPCCRVEICREAFESPFLKSIESAVPRFDESRGYLGAAGCLLKAGRPTLCHAFVCDRIMNSQSDAVHRYALRCLGDLMSYVGRKVWRGRHPSAATMPDELSAMNVGRFRKRMVSAEAALEILDDLFTRNRSLGCAEFDTLAAIRKPTAGTASPSSNPAGLE